MNYELVKSSYVDIDRLVDYKKRIIYAHAKDLTKDEINEIDSYAIKEVTNLLNEYFNIVADNKVVGSLLLINKDDGKLLDEIYLEEEYRNKGIGTDIINNIMNDNDIVYLWVYKDNKKAINLYEKMGFKIIDETETRYYMKYSK